MNDPDRVGASDGRTVERHAGQHTGRVTFVEAGRSRFKGAEPIGEPVTIHVRALFGARSQTFLLPRFSESQRLRIDRHRVECLRR